MPSKNLSRIPELIEPWFIFSLIWSVGATGDYTSRLTFSQWLRVKMVTEEVRSSRTGQASRANGRQPTWTHSLLLLLLPGETTFPKRRAGVRLQTG